MFEILTLDEGPTSTKDAAFHLSDLNKKQGKMYQELRSSQEKNQTQSPSPTRHINSNAKEYIEDIGPKGIGSIEKFAVSSELVEFLLSFRTKKRLQVELMLKHKCFYGSMENLAAQVGYSREHAGRFATSLVKAGFFVRNDRGAFKTSVYWVNPDIYSNEKLCLEISKLFLLPGLSKCPFVNPVLEPNVTQEIFSYSLSSSLSKLGTKLLSYAPLTRGELSQTKEELGEEEAFSLFSSQAIEYALEKLVLAKHVRNPITWLLHMCSFYEETGCTEIDKQNRRHVFSLSFRKEKELKLEERPVELRREDVRTSSFRREEKMVSTVNDPELAQAILLFKQRVEANANFS